MIQIFSLFLITLALLGVNSVSTMEDLITRQASAWEQGDVSTIVRDFAPDAVFIAAGKTFSGVEAIKTAAEAYFRQATNTKITIKRIIIDNNQGAVEWNWSDRNRKTGEQSYAEDAIIFEVQDDGKISYWREYIEKTSKS